MKVDASKFSNFRSFPIFSAFPGSVVTLRHWYILLIQLTSLLLIKGRNNYAQFQSRWVFQRWKPLSFICDRIYEALLLLMADNVREGCGCDFEDDSNLFFFFFFVKKSITLI